jgi:hypothetical protein
MAMLGMGAAGILQHAGNPRDQFVAQLFNPNQPPAQGQGKAEMSNARIVKVFIADPNENLPLEKRVLYKGDEMLTDLTDQELFYEVPIAELLAKHNDYRKTVVDKKQAEKFGRDIFMEPARIRDLRMVVVDVAKF